jgi:putative peptide zinc metalloprotease protein
MQPQPSAGQLDPAVRIAPDPDDPGVYIARMEPGGASIRLSPAQAYLAENMRAPYSEVVLIAKCNARFPEHLTLRDLSTLVSRLEEAGMMAGPARDDALSHAGATPEPPSAASVSRSGPEQETPRRFPNHWSLCRPEPFLDLLLPAVAWMRFLKLLVPVAVILAAVGFANNLDLFFADISAIKTRVSYFGRVLFTLFTISLITQIFRGLTARHFRFETPSFGLMLVFGLLPRFNMKIIVPEDADRHARLWALGAPIYIRFIVFPAGIMAWVAFREQGTALSQISAGLAMVSMISFLFVSNPLLGGAGYRFLSEWFAVNNLRQKAFARLSSFFSRRPPVVMQYMDRSPAVLVYGLVSIVFTLALVGFISMTAARWLELNYQGLGVTVFLLVLVYLFFRFVYKKLVLRRKRRRAETLVQDSESGERPVSGQSPASETSVSRNRSTTGAPQSRRRVRYLVLLLLLGVCFLPYHYESGGDAEVFPMASAAIYPKYPDLLDTIHYQGGEVLAQGTVVAEMVNDRQMYDVEKTREELKKKQAELDVLLTTPSPEQITLAEEEVKTARVMLQYSRQQFDRMNQLYQKEIVSFVDYEDALRQMELDQQLLSAAKARLADIKTRVNAHEIEAARIEIDLLKTQLAYHEQVLDRTRLKMPITGRIITMNLKNLQDTYLDEGVLFAEVEDISKVRVEIRIPESDAVEIGVGHTVRLRLRASPNQHFEGRVDKIYPAAVVDATGRFVICESILDNDEDLFRSGMTGFAKIEGRNMFVIEAFSRALVRFVKVEVWSWLP